MTITWVWEVVESLPTKPEPSYIVRFVSTDGDEATDILRYYRQKYPDTRFTLSRFIVD